MNAPRQTDFGFLAEGQATTAPQLDTYTKFIVFYSSGKDSVACVLHLLECGVEPSRIELHHHLVDGHPDEGSNLMDWPVTDAYCKAFADHFGLEYYRSWRHGGIEKEMLRDNERTAPVRFETPEGNIEQRGGTLGPLGTRRKFPQVTANLQTRWCSSAAKIDVGSCMIANQSRFVEAGTKYLVVTGERAAESFARAKYETFEPHRTDNRAGKRVRRWVDHWRPVHKWSDTEVWAILERHRVVPHPAYRLGWGRVSCITCIFGSANQWASVKAIAPEKFEQIAQYEEEFGFTINRKLSVRQLAAMGKPYPMDPDVVEIALASEYTGDIVTDNWELPPGAFGEACGPL